MSQLLEHGERGKWSFGMNYERFSLPYDRADLEHPCRKIDVLIRGIWEPFVESTSAKENVAFVRTIACQINAALEIPRAFPDRIEFSGIVCLDLPSTPAASG